MSTQNMPGFTADVSLYHSDGLYRGKSVTSEYASNGIFLQDTNSCMGECTGKLWLCVLTQLGQLGSIGCALDFNNCNNSCVPPPYDGPTTPVPQGCCPTGKRCCGSCASGRCDDVCVGAGQSCN